MYNTKIKYKKINKNCNNLCWIEKKVIIIKIDKKIYL